MNLNASEDDMKAYIGAHMFMSINPQVQINHYRSTDEMFHNTYMSSRISGRQFKELSKMFNVSVPSNEVPQDKLRRYLLLYDYYYFHCISY